jgi:DNA-binding SARP family transcriptional activator
MPNHGELPEFRVLGPVEVTCAGRAVPIGAGKQRVVLAALLLRANETVSVDRLIEHLWHDRQPAGARDTLYAYVMRLRKALVAGGLPAGLIQTAGSGYTIEVEPASLDLHRYRDLVGRAESAATTGDPAAESTLLRGALDLWRGEVLANVPSESLVQEMAPLLEERLQVWERRVDVDLRLGRAGELVGPLRALVEEHPARERFWAQLMLALYRSGRQAEALDAYRTVSTFLADELGVDPGADLRSTHRAILTGEGAPVEAPRPATAPAQLPPAPPDFVGRADLVDRIYALLDGDRASAAVTVSGSPGVGKSALALRVAHRLSGRFPDGQLYADLGAEEQPLPRFLGALGVPPDRVPAAPDEQERLYRSRLAGRRVLVVLDNAASADQVRPLLTGDPAGPVLVTSRHTLPTLTAFHGARPVPVDVLTPDEARDLLAGMLGDDLVAAEPAAVAELARLCEYLPLALRIAAAKLITRLWPRVADYVLELRADDRLSALAIDGDRGGSVRAAIDDSYTALDPDLRRFFRQLSLIPAGELTLRAVAALAGLGADQARRRLDRLASVNLLQHSAAGRYRFRALIREYAGLCRQENELLAPTAA